MPRDDCFGVRVVARLVRGADGPGFERCSSQDFPIYVRFFSGFRVHTRARRYCVFPRTIDLDRSVYFFVYYGCARACVCVWCGVCSSVGSWRPYTVIKNDDCFDSCSVYELNFL
jgi:hypothetical protein